MGNRSYLGFVAIFWLAAMCWLAVEKVLPPLIGGTAPDYRASLAAAPREPPPVVWRLLWKERAVGHAATRVRPTADGGAELRSLVRFEKLDLKELLQQVLGAFVSLIPSLGDDDFQLEMAVASRIRFDRQQVLQELDTTIEVADMPRVLNLHGTAPDGRTLDLVVFSGSERPAAAADRDDDLVHHRIDLPRDALVGDGFAPDSELKNLKVGQTWTIPVYRPFPPNSPVQIIEAKAERMDELYWDGEPVEVVVVAYRGDAGSGIVAGREPIGRVWVRPDGLVLQQEVVVSGLRLVFERLPEDEGAEFAAGLADEEFLPRFPRAAPADRKPAAE